MRKFKSGATRNNDEQKINIIGSFSPLVVCRFAQFMRDHNIKDGKLKRDEANWKKGMPKQSYLESKARHFLDTWKTHEGYEDGNIEEMLCADIFNSMGHLHELLVEKLKAKRKNKKPTMTAVKALAQVINAYGLKFEDITSIFKNLK